MSATPFTKERFWLPGSIALIVAFVAAGCGGGTPAPTPTGDDSNTPDTTAASNPGAGGDPAVGGIPGDPVAGGIPGDPAASGDIRAGGGGNAQPQAPPENSPAFPAFHLVMGLMNGKPADIGKYVGKRATGDLATIRTGKLSAKRVAELKATFARPTLISQKRISGGTQINLRSGEQVINITVKKEGGAFKVSDMKIRKSSSRR